MSTSVVIIILTTLKNPEKSESPALIFSVIFSHHFVFGKTELCNITCHFLVLPSFWKFKLLCPYEKNQKKAHGDTRSYQRLAFLEKSFMKKYIKMHIVLNL